MVVFVSCVCRCTLHQKIIELSNNANRVSLYEVRIESCLVVLNDYEQQVLSCCVIYCEMNIERKIHLPKELQIFLDLLTTDYILFSTQTYGSYIEFNKYPFYENYFVVYRDNRMLRRLIDGEFYRNNKNSTIKYFFVVHQGVTKYVHDKSNRLHSHMLMSTPDYRHVKNKHKVDLKSCPYRTMNHVVNRCLTKYQRFGRTDVRGTFDIRISERLFDERNHTKR